MSLRRGLDFVNHERHHHDAAVNIGQSATPMVQTSAQMEWLALMDPA